MLVRQDREPARRRFFDACDSPCTPQLVDFFFQIIGWHLDGLDPLRAPFAAPTVALYSESVLASELSFAFAALSFSLRLGLRVEGNVRITASRGVAGSVEPTEPPRVTMPRSRSNS